MEERDGAKKNSIKNPKLLKSYKSLRNKVTNTIRSSIRLHNQSMINENKGNPKNIWRTINKVLDKAPNSTTIMQVRDGSKTVSDSKQIANVLNGHFVNVGPEGQITDFFRTPFLKSQKNHTQKAPKITNH